MNFCLLKLCNYKKLSKVFLLVTMMLSISVMTYAQAGHTVTGKLTDDAGDPLIGAAIKVKGTGTGAIANLEGNYSVQVADADNSVLEVSYLGYQTKEVPVKGQQVINITLKNEAFALTETVVVGYGVQKKIHMTGSVVQVGAEDILKAPVSNLTQSLVGKLPGIVSSQSNGAPGADGTSLIIRGYSSSNGGGGPLILVDGIERTMDRIDPNDVESVSVLKDGAATAVYGMRATNGVILVTTKRGKEGAKPQISYHGSVTFSKKTTMPKFMNGTQYMEWYNKARSIAHHFDPSQSSEPKFTDDHIAMVNNGDPTDGYHNTDWLSPLDKYSPMHQHNLSVSGSGKSVRYFVSGGFMDQKGFFSEHRFKRTNFRSNIDVDATEDITVSFNVAGRLERSNTPGALRYENQGYNNVVGVMMYALPFVPKEVDGIPTSGYRGGANPEYARHNSGYSRNEKNIIETSAKLEYRLPFLEGLKTSVLLAYDFDDAAGKSFKNAYPINQYSFATLGYTQSVSPNIKEEGSLYVDNRKKSQVQVRPTIEYQNTFNKHAVSGIVLFERTETKHSNMSAQRNDFTIFDHPELSLGSEFPKGASNSGGSNKTAMAGVVGRANYVYNSRYLAEFAFRYDGSFRFASGYRWDLFPSVSAGWVISEEEFMKERFDKLDKLKVRASYGRTSNDNVNPDLWRRLYAMYNPIGLGNGSKYYKTLHMDNIYLSEELTWEKTDTYNLGIEVEIANGLFGMDFDVFYKSTFDILQGYSGINSPSLGKNYPKSENSGKFSAQGFELQLRHRYKIADFSYSINGNLSLAKNKYLEIREAEGTMPWASLIGNPRSAIYGYKSKGLAQTQEDIDNAAKPTAGKLGLGDIMYEDLNGDGKIDNQDITKIAKGAMPEMMFAFNVDLYYKGFDLSAQFQGAALVDKMLCGTWDNKATDNTPLTKPFYGGSDNSPLYLVEQSWTPENTDARYPRLTTVNNVNNSLLSDFWKENGAYLRLKTLTLGYTLPAHITSKAKMSNLRLYLAATNLFTITSFKYLDPESPSVLQGYYPQQKSFSIGLNLSF